MLHYACFFYAKELVKWVNDNHIRRDQIIQITSNMDSSRQMMEYTVFYWA